MNDKPHIVRINPDEIDLRAVATCLEPLDRTISELERILRDWNTDRKAA